MYEELFSYSTFFKYDTLLIGFAFKGSKVMPSKTFEVSY